MKFCAGCNQTLASESFAANQSRCRECRRVYGQAHYSEGNRCPCGVLIVNKALHCAPCSAVVRTGAKPDKRWINQHGYAVLNNKHGHPNAWKNGNMLEHTFVMSQALGRPLLPEEEVHHKNGVRDDNNLSNLELWSKSQPAGQRVEDKLAWADQIIELYRPKAET